MKNILIVDDEEGIRRMYSRLLEDEGYNTEIASTADDAVCIIDSKAIDLVLLDIHMPRKKGGVVFDYIREHNPELKVIVTSVYQMDDQRRIMPGAADYHDKAQDNELLLSKIKTFLNTV